MAMVVITSKYMIALMPIRPTSLASDSLAIPTTTVTNTIGAMIIRTSLMKASPNGCICTASAGQKYPSAAPSTTPSRTWMYKPLG